MSDLNTPRGLALAMMAQGDNRDMIGQAGPRLAFYASPERMNKIGYNQTPDDKLMNYDDPVDDNQYRWISDEGLASKGNAHPKTFGDAISHDLLFEAYPELKNMPVDSTGTKRRDDLVPIDESGWYDHKTKSFGLNNALDERISLHEGQHAIQGIEGWFPNVVGLADALRKMAINIDSNDTGFLGDGLYTNRGDEAQAFMINRALESGIPKDGALANIRATMANENLNSNFINEGAFLDTMKRNLKTDNYDAMDLVNLDVKYDATKNSTKRGPFMEPPKDWGYTDEEYELALDNAFSKAIDGPHIFNPYAKKNPFRNMGRR